MLSLPFARRPARAGTAAAVLRAARVAGLVLGAAGVGGCSLWPFGSSRQPDPTPSSSSSAPHVAQPPLPASTPAPAPSGSASGDCSVVLYGDSILHGGYGGNLRLAEPPAATLKRLRPRFSVDDRTANGETATARAARFASEKRTAHFVVIGHGLNDAALSLPVEAPLRSMIGTATGEGRVVILTGLSRQRVAVPGRDRYDDTIRRMARETGAGFADWGAAEFRANEMADILHPAKGYSERLSMRIVRELDRLAPECRA